jgi:hypothetical protein
MYLRFDRALQGGDVEEIILSGQQHIGAMGKWMEVVINIENDKFYR